MNKESTQYGNINLDVYNKRIENLLHDERLLSLGLKKHKLAKTEYGYNLDYLTIGYGKKDLFLVGGTHGSEIIGVDFLTHFIKNLPNLKDFDPNKLTIHIIPMQNPEGFDISTGMLKNIEEYDFAKTSYEYYLRYRIDNLMSNAYESLNQLFNNLNNQNVILIPNQLLRQLKRFINKDTSWQALMGYRELPKLKVFNTLFNNLKYVKSYPELQEKILYVCNKTLSTINDNSIHDYFLKEFITNLKQGFSSKVLWKDINTSQVKKLHQKMFEKEVTKTHNKDLAKDIYNIGFVKGSEVTWDATGGLLPINLNSNSKSNRGIDAIKNNLVVYGVNSRRNIRNYFPGPLGLPTKDINNFSYAIENKALYYLIESSYKRNRYAATILYHGTGGGIYYKPYQYNMDEEQYEIYSKNNKELASIYSLETDYQLYKTLLNNSYDDYLRATFPNVLLVELSKMGGNPLGPYGDINNYERVMLNNTNALNAITKHLTEEYTKKLSK